MALKDLIVPTLAVFGILYFVKGCNNEKDHPVRTYEPRQPAPIYQRSETIQPEQEETYCRETCIEEPGQTTIIRHKRYKKVYTTTAVYGYENN